MSESNLTLLTTCGDPAEAAALRTLLEANGIRCVVQGEQHRSMLGVMGGYIEVNVLVAERDLEQARALLREPAEGASEESGSRSAPTESLEDAVCPVHGERATATCSRCGTFLCANCQVGGSVCEDCAEREGASNEVRRGSRRRLAAWLVLGLLFGPTLLMVLATLLGQFLG